MMEKAEMREIILEAIGKLSLKSFDFELICREIGSFLNKGNPVDLSPEYEEKITEVIRELVKERIICPVPHGKPTFFVNK